MKKLFISAWANEVFQKDGVICFDIHADKSGAIDPDQIRQVGSVKEIFNEKALN
jgi:hypothetical protein